MYRFFAKSVLLLWLCCGAYTASRAQLLRDADTQGVLRQAIDRIYSFQFAEAEPLIATVRARYPQHPVSPMLAALKLYWQGMPLRKEKPLYAEYLRQVQLTLRQADVLLARDENDPEGTFFALAAHSYLALQASEEGQTMEALSEARKAYGYLRAGMKLTGTYADFYLSTGLYNYYVVQYPQTHPAVKPLMLFFADGDKQAGLAQLETGAAKGVFTRTEALYYLLHIYAKHEMDWTRALACSSRLYAQFPANLLFLMRHAEMLVLNGRYDEAAPLAGQLAALPDKVFQATAAVLRGMIAEKGRRDFAEARRQYGTALRLRAYDRRYTQDYYGMAYAGLARLAAREGKKEDAKHLYKKALELAEYESTRREAKNYLKND
ncbi:MAG TPA: ABC transporter substrate-binding protein [Cytophagales bacterium]